MKFKSCDRPFTCFIIATVHVLQLSHTGRESCNNDGEVQLVGGQSRFEGRVEVCDSRTWKTVCDRMWREEEAKVVCRQLNYPDPSNATYVRRACAGQGSEDQDTLKVVWECCGGESNLLDCNRTQTTHPCDHRRDAGVYCSGQTPDNCEEDTIRLVDGPNNASGRVEVCRFGCWGTVCDEGWDRNSSIVACKELGFKTEQAIPTRGGYFSSTSCTGSSRLTHISQTECEGDGIKLTKCSEFKLNNCTHSQDAGVICHGMSMCRDGDIQLVGGESDREEIVEMCYNKVWGTVCADGWNRMAANIVCTQLGYEYIYSDRVNISVHAYAYGSPPSMFRHRLQNTPTLFHNVNCSEAHSMFLQCVDLHTVGVYNCGGNATAGVSCPSKSSSSSSNIHIVILGSVGTTAAVVTGLIVIVTITLILKMKKRRNSGSSAINDVNVPMKENEAYGTVHVTHHIETVK